VQAEQECDVVTGIKMELIGSTPEHVALNLSRTVTEPRAFRIMLKEELGRYKRIFHPSRDAKAFCPTCSEE